MCTETGRLRSLAIAAGAEATEALAGAVQWLPNLYSNADAPGSRRTTASEAGDAAAASAAAEAGADGAPASASAAEAEVLSTNEHGDAAPGASPKSQQEAPAAEAGGGATPSGNFETMTFHVGGEFACH